MDKKNVTKKPNVIFKSSELERRVDAWLDSKNPTKEEFGKLLSKLGYASGETVVLDDYDKENCSFSCICNSVSANHPQSARISLRFGGMEDFPELTIHTDEYDKSYACVYNHDQEEEGLRLESYNLRNQNNGNALHRCLYSFRWEAEVEYARDNEVYSFSVFASKPENAAGSGFYELKNSEELQNYLLGLSFPISIEEVYRRVCEISLTPVTDFPAITLCASSKRGNEEAQVTDLVQMEHGMIKRFTITRDGVTISVDSSGSWSYQGGSLRVSQDEDGKVNYSLTRLPEYAIFDLTPVSERYIMIKPQIEETREKAGKLLSKK